MELLLGFLSGMFLTNGIPHFISGCIGKTHMTPFAKESSATLNVMWGFINFLLGLMILRYSNHTIVDALVMDSFSWSFLAGVVVMGVACAMLFSNKNAKFPWFK